MLYIMGMGSVSSVFDIMGMVVWAQCLTSWEWGGCKLSV